MTRTRTFAYATAAVLAAITGSAVGHLAAAIVAPSASPVLAVGSVVIDLTPTPVKEWAVATLGTADKPVLVGSVGLAALALAGAIGIVARHRRPLALSLIVALALLPALAAVARSAPTSGTGWQATALGAGLLALTPSLITAVVGALSAALLFRRLDALSATPQAVGIPGASHPETEPTSTQPAVPQRAATRRSLLTASGALVTLTVLATAAGSAISRGASAVVSGLTLPRPRQPLPPIPTGLEGTTPGLSTFVTPNGEFYRVDTALTVPRVNLDTWTLTIDGAVQRPVVLTWADLLDLPMVEADVTLTCVSNEVGGSYVGGARWLGVPVRDLLARAGVDPSADQVLSHSIDGMTISTPIAALTDDRPALVAIAMNGVPLPPDHGFPARLVTPGLYGFVGATKWLTRLEVTTYAAAQAYWTERDWAIDAPVITQARIDTPRGLARLQAGTHVIGGVAWAQRRGVAGVEVRVDDGPWQPATLGPDAGIDYWRQWYLPWDATPGRHDLQVRATDSTGTLSPIESTTPFPRGAQGWHRIVVNVQ